ncbi:hypothetical protein Taro_049794 [Colocasia esculenta]|uniref:Uncharacterized protein n=1 Tax=Colocasia esculenta TaxID=4460 RepID=A0A843XC34_COLES|nr:hypothetical protein [Colocasia esculenta]
MREYMGVALNESAFPRVGPYGPEHESSNGQGAEVMKNVQGGWRSRRNIQRRDILDSGILAGGRLSPGFDWSNMQRDIKLVSARCAHITIGSRRLPLTVVRWTGLGLKGWRFNTILVVHIIKISMKEFHN